MSNSIRLAVIGGFPPDIQGEANYNGSVFQEFFRLYPDIQVKLFAHKTGYKVTQSVLSENAEVVRITGHGSRFRRTLSVIILFFRLVRYGPNVIHFQGVHTPLYGGLWGEPLLLILLYFKVFSTSKLIYTLHSTWKKNDLELLFGEKSLKRPFKLLLTTYYGIYLKTVLFCCNKFRILTTGYEYKEAELFISSWKVSLSKIDFELHPCANPLDNLVALNHESKRKIGYEDRILIICSGFIRRDKNLHQLISAVAQLKMSHHNLVLYIVGKALRPEDQDYYKELIKMVERMNISDNIIINNSFLSDEVLGVYFSAADIVAIPYGRVIGASGPIHHAMSRGKHIVASNLGHNQGLKGIIDLFEPESVSSLTLALNNAIIKSKCGLNQACLDYANQHTWNRLAKDYFNIYVDKYE